MSTRPGAAQAFPDDLLRLQHDWTRTYNRLAYRPATGAAELRAGLFALTVRIDSHPHWRTAGWSREGRTRLWKAAQEGPGGVREVSVRWVGGEFVVTEPERGPDE
ncbi:hypothetical protein [Streptomyces sp. NBC_01565]|uniref:hypothetical protein n=1 Tax=Streptomyces sp. NBC_01565 TaxID=2975881 RepID=UPI0022567616|nr:hypothetical protein [Streptomyces sp. NBC_01565]MCX4547187.1 hypothetical protein [Streptomyces sp. NBC_01565]